jgi:3-methyl-2-oxobutanoate hydroxymethyltransferase|tara:strand:- start:517 stop:1308 length:792 start_codon:yes stop_codon:yes gene_type:complete
MKTVPDFQKWKVARTPITMVTCYDAATSKILNETSVDALLVGDSCAMVVHGYDSTIHATVEMMVTHTAATRRGAPDKVIVADMPFLSYRGSIDASTQAVSELMRAGANAVKVERSKGNCELISRLVEAGIPVMGHLGLTPQSIHEFGGFKMQARSDDAAQILMEEALELEEAGCFSIVLECIPGHVAESVTDALAIPTIGIGCGPGTSGQVLVINDLLGLDSSFQPPFARRYMDADQMIVRSIEGYCEDVRELEYPGEGEYKP